MFERFTDRARRVVVLAQEEARLLGHNYIGTEHILLGLVHEQEGIAAKTLEQLGISLEAARSKVESIIGTGGGFPGGHIPFTPAAKKVLELSLREAFQLGHDYIATEHLLLGLVREGEGVAAQALVGLGAELPTVRQAVLQQLSGVGGGGEPRARRPRPATLAAAAVGVEARGLAGSGAVGSHHYLLALLAQEDSLAAKALAALGVTREAVEQQLSELDPVGTSDETPEEAGSRRISLRLEGQLITLEVDDPDLAASIEKAISGRKVRITRGIDPEGEEFSARWSTSIRTRRRPAGAERRPPGWHPGGHAGVYWMVSTPGGMSRQLQCWEGTDRSSLRAWLRAWLTANGPNLVASEREPPACCSLWAYVDAAGDSFSMASFGFGPEGPPGCEPVSLDVLIERAVADLA
jgi:ATP-dependent Clp protease ATP-binding subunit ClpA